MLEVVRHPVRRVALTTIYALGLRLGEGLALEAEHIDSQRLSVSVRDGKGARDRVVPLPRPLLARLRHYWKIDRPESAAVTASESVGFQKRAPRAGHPSIQSERDSVKTSRQTDTITGLGTGTNRQRPDPTLRSPASTGKGAPS